MTKISKQCFCFALGLISAPVTKTRRSPLLYPEYGIEDVVVGMAHRGKLELLTCILGFPPAKIFGKVSVVCDVF
jgi:hypothetical protein